MYSNILSDLKIVCLVLRTVCFRKSDSKGEEEGNAVNSVIAKTAGAAVQKGNILFIVMIN